MEFKENTAIYLQIADYVSENILSGEWKTEHKIPSVRDLAIQLEVNPNTVMRSYDYLQNLELIFNKRGMGFYVDVNAPERLKEIRKERFLKQELPAFYKKLKDMSIEIKDLEDGFEKFKQNLLNNKKD